MAAKQTRPSWVSDLSPRHVEVLRLIGSERLSYKAAARRMDHRYIDDRQLSVSTVRKYVQQVYDLTDGSGNPKEWLIWLWGEHKDELDEGAA